MRFLLAITLSLFTLQSWAADPKLPKKPAKFTSQQQVDEYYSQLRSYVQFHRGLYEADKTKWEQGGTYKDANNQVVAWEGLVKQREYLAGVNKQLEALEAGKSKIKPDDDQALAEFFGTRAKLSAKQKHYQTMIADLEAKQKKHALEPMAQLDKSLKEVAAEQAAAISQFNAAVTHVHVALDGKRLEDDAREFMAAADKVDGAYEQLGRKYENSFLKVYMASRFQKLLNSDAMCKASANCKDQKMGAAKDYNSDLQKVFTEPAAAGANGGTPKATAQ